MHFRRPRGLFAPNAAVRLTQYRFLFAQKTAHAVDDEGIGGKRVGAIPQVFPILLLKPYDLKASREYFRQRTGARKKGRIAGGHAEIYGLWGRCAVLPFRGGRMCGRAAAGTARRAVRRAVRARQLRKDRAALLCIHVIGHKREDLLCQYFGILLVLP